MGEVIKLRAREIELGRGPGQQVRVVYEGEKVVVQIPDPYSYISRRHAKIYYDRGEWKLVDLGSLNKTAVYRRGKWHIVWRGHREISDAFKLENGDVIALAYDEKLGPYVQLVFRAKT